MFAARQQRLRRPAIKNWKEWVSMSVGKIPVGKIVVRTVEAVLAVWIITDALGPL
jgi:hypothetical protein